METLFSASGFGPEAGLSAIPRTPPYTPSRAKRQLEPTDSPASSNAGSIHPIDTSSPHKKVGKPETRDDLKIEELTEGDDGYHTDLDIVYPDELEEISSGSEDNDEDDDGFSSSSESDIEAAGLTRHMSRMQCEDDDFEEYRRRARAHKRTDSRMFKRTHSQSVKSETEGTDADGKDDHDLESSKRRLRRRVQGPQSAPSLLEGLVRSSPEAGHWSSGTDSKHATRPRRATVESEDMDLDPEK